MTHEPSQIQRLRRLAARQHLRLVKLREGRWYQQYGPFMLVDTTTNGTVAYGLQLDQVEAELQAS